MILNYCMGTFTQVLNTAVCQEQTSVCFIRARGLSSLTNESLNRLTARREKTPPPPIPKAPVL